ncbi:MAG: hypothetical protein H7095_04845 [Pseudopedobacter sp.]|nr:hypothetical protein [Deinococcales bacterium]
MQDSRRSKTEQRAYLERRNALWQKLRLLEPGDEGVEELLLELAQFTRQTRVEIWRGLGWVEYEQG